VIFDVEVIFLYPWAVVFRQLEVFGLIQMGIFIGLLLVAYVYDWRRGGLEWERAGSSMPTPMPHRARSARSQSTLRGRR
jgi:NADH-ubiquinone/plastoquinone oxidoreductase, chain 3